MTTDYINGIRCPQCGDRRKIQIGNNDFQCTNCYSKYYIDANGIAVIRTNSQQMPPPASSYSPPPKKKSRKGLYIGIGIAVFILLLAAAIFGAIMLAKQIRESNGNKGSLYSKDYFSHSMLDFPIVAKGDVYIFSVGQRTYKGKKAYSYNEKDERNGFYFSFVDPDNGDIVADGKLDNTNIKNLGILRSRKFINGKTYVIINDRFVYEIDQKNMSFKDITDDIFPKTDSIYQYGIAKIEFLYKSNGDGFNILTNRGTEIKRNPLSPTINDKPKSYDEWLAGTRDSTYFDFSSKWSAYDDVPQSKEDETQLLKIVYKYNFNHPIKPEWKEISTEMFGRDKKLVLLHNEPLVVSYENITPGRLYFYPEVLYYDTNHLLIKYCENPAEDSPIILQSLDNETGKVKWSYTYNAENRSRYYFSTENSAYADGKYLLKIQGAKYLLIDKDGKNEKEFNLYTNY